MLLDIEALEKKKLPCAYKIVRAHIIESRRIWPPMTLKVIKEEYGMKYSEWAKDLAQLRFMVACANELRIDVMNMRKDQGELVALGVMDAHDGPKAKWYRFDNGELYTIRLLMKIYPDLSRAALKGAVYRLGGAGEVVQKKYWDAWVEKYRAGVWSKKGK